MQFDKQVERTLFRLGNPSLSTAEDMVKSLYQEKYDHLVIGSGIAGLTLALKLAKQARVLVVAKGELAETATSWAQGGIASVLGDNDTFVKHAEDTKSAGAGLCREEIVDLVVRAGPRLIQELIDLGVNFTRETGIEQQSTPYHLTREGGHSERRVIHSKDVTGQEVQRALVQAVRQEPNITIREQVFGMDLITSDKYAPDFRANRCLGAYLFDRRTHEILAVRAGQTYLCTGGHGRVYLYTSNPDVATGDGLAMGWRAGCRVANLEFMQFHPTCLYHPAAKTFLISESVRGEGGELKNIRGEPFMLQHHPLGSLAPRDIVARAIDQELKSTGEAFVYVDIRHLGAERIRQLFPNIYETCLQYGIDITQQMIPVVPAAHYSCGGLVVDEYGRTNVEGLFAIGEVACTGLHGANRLASNSLLEALVFADRAADFALSVPAQEDVTLAIPPWNKGNAVAPDELGVLSHIWDEIRRLMWHYVGIVRTDKRLSRAYDRIVALQHELDQYYWNYEVTENLIEVRNLALVANLTIRCAMARKESRGIHFNLDYPFTDDAFSRKDSVIR